MGTVYNKNGGGGRSGLVYLYLGTGTSFDVKSKISASTDSVVKKIDYTKLTSNNFVIEPTSGYSYSGSGESERADVGWKSSATNHSTIAPSKTYNASTGTLTASYSWTGGASYRIASMNRAGSISCKAYMVFNTEG